uniref:Osteomodulin n=1 Tax=Cyprinus carpio TaxID=7962 RepID=A0A8C2G9Q7_CYPCA
MQINMCNNKLKSMPADLPESIQQISLENNSIASIPEGYFKKTPNLLSLRMPHNKLKSVAYSAFNLPKLMETLEHLYLNHNDFKDLNISLMLDYYAYRCFPRLIFYGNQRKDNEEDSETKKYVKPKRPKATIDLID